MILKELMVDGTSPVSLPLLVKVFDKGVREEYPSGILAPDTPHKQPPKYIKNTRATRNLLREDLALWYKTLGS